MSARPTAHELLAHGLEFVRDDVGHITGLRGPKAVTAAAAREIARRAEIFEPQVCCLGPGRVPVLPGAKPARGACCNCGETLEPPFTGGGCDLCHAALWRAVRTKTEARRAA